MRRDALTFALCATLVACGGRAELLDFGEAAEDSAPPPGEDAAIDGGTDAEDAAIDVVADDSSTDGPSADDSSIADAGDATLADAGDATLADAADATLADDSSPPDDSSPAIDAADAADTSLPDSGPDAPDSELDATDANTCTFAFAPGALIGSANVAGVQNIPSGVTPTGSSILIQRGGPASLCSSDLLLFIADEIPAGSGTYQTLGVEPPLGMDTGFEENVTLTADGLTIIGLSTDDTSFVTSARTAIGVADFAEATAGPFGQITVTGSAVLWAPVITADGLDFYYTVRAAPDGAVDGIYESIRASTSDPFPPGTLMPAAVQNIAQYVTGLTVDRLTIFLEESSVFGAVALTRASVGDPFTNPYAPSPPPLLPGLRPHPIDGCTEEIGTCGAGCSSEGICAFVPQ